MTDLEATRLCAKAMRYADKSVGESVGGIMVCGERYHFIWNPLEDDAQAMALVKRFKLSALWGSGTFAVFQSHLPREAGSSVYNADINRAIVFTVAAMQRAKGAG